MKKLVLSVAIASILGLSACDDESIKDVQKEVIDNGSAVTSPARVVFNPSAGVLSVPNDLLFSGTTDGTLNMPGESDENGNPLAMPNYADPSTALGAIDGWSTVNPFVLAIDFPDGKTLNAASASIPGSIKIFEATMGGDALDADCTALARGLACKIVSELAFGTDFITQASGNSVAIVPLHPLKSATTYLVVMTDSLVDSNGDAIEPSTTYELVRQDINTLPLGNTDQLALQGIVNSFEAAVEGEGVAHDSIIYSMAMTTQSTTTVLTTVKTLLASGLAQGAMPPVITINAPVATVKDVFLSKGLSLSPELQALYSTAYYHTGSVDLPYYLPVPSAENPKAPVNDRWRALCDSGVMLAGLAAANPELIPEGPLDANDGLCMAVGLRDLSSVMPLDTQRHLTKYNPVPKVTASMTLDVQMTTPVISPVTDAVRAGFGLPALTAMPDAGWPVVILQHGITSKKSDMLAITGVLSAFGFATVAIDHPLHGSRGFELDGNLENGDEINASTVSATHYMNLASLLTTRDNLRQSSIDLLGLRLGLNAVSGVSIDSANVHFLGHSLGAIAGINFLALTNSSLESVNPALAPLDAMFSVKTNTLAMPGIMVANFLMESGAFGDVIKSGLTYAQSAEFKALVDSMFPLDENGKSTATEAQLVGTYQAFYDALSTEQQAGLNGVFAQFTFAAQTVTDAGDPINYIGSMAATQTPTHLIEVVGNGVDAAGACENILVTDNCSDQVIPNQASSAPNAGTEGTIRLLGLPGVSSTAQGSGAVRFLYGHHGSILDPNVRVESPDAMLSAAATQEMQAQVAVFFYSMGTTIKVTNEAVVK
jgi:Pla-1/cef family extracellular lipase